MRTQKKSFRNFRETENLDIFVNFPKKKRFFLHFKIVIFLFDFILQFLKKSDTSEYNATY